MTWPGTNAWFWGFEQTTKLDDRIYGMARTGIPCVTDCVIAELEKLGPKYRIALRVARDPRFERLPCSHGGTYADDCLVQRVTANKCYIVATCDRELRRRIRKVGGVCMRVVCLTG